MADSVSRFGMSAFHPMLTGYFTFDQVTAVIGILGDKDAAGILHALAGVVDNFVITQSSSERSVGAEELAAIAISIVGAARVTVEPSFEAALEFARERASESPKGAALVTGSITLVGDAIVYARRQGWKP